VPRLLIHRDAEQDFRDLARTQPKLFGRLLALLQEIGSDTRLIEILTVHGFGSDERGPFDVKKWFEHWNAGKDIWRLKFWELEHQGLPYRVIYALKRGTGDYHVLAIVERGFNYDRNHIVTQRILRAYDDL
jgi:hypothetical protein